MQNTMVDIPRKRPGLVTVLAILLGIQGIILLILSIFAFVAVFTGGRINVFSSTSLANYVDVISATWLVEGLVLLYLAWGLWMLKRWAYWATLVLEFLILLSSALELAQPQPALWQTANWAVALSLLFSLGILVCFLVGSNIRSAFRI
ncbi:MAG: hypothetical protein ACJ8BW_36855 [Ktedonobacteraceae bacterium]|jgi:hypothetical protein